MESVKKDHSIGSGTGAAAGVVSGALVGAAAGPIGAAIGAILGGIAGAKVGDSIAEKVNPTEYDAYWQKEYKSRPYYDAKRDWKDYAPAYGLGYHAAGTYPGKRYEEVESDLERNWDEMKQDSSLAWNEARDAVRDGWHYVERKLPGDFDRDGR